MKKVFLLISVGMMVVSCSTTAPLYSWYNSEDASYQYTKRLTEKELTEAMAQYEMVIQKQKGSRATVPPGVNAEYGYMLVKAGKKEQGLALLKSEMELYPESKVFISRIVNQLEK
jgi:hypothetical protein